ncbi:hypothetical protein CTA1_11955 [Colletotrichum tanaceti]|uniref:Ecp2 effector protein domain-containing protein n=1 Tax=Colletotrichum tanaceti TaxID=1306861 RepID=A0A4U6XKZ5_9PEZI|nr:hypothetical protein CTA1_11955 [Colletotrichum tanaceti]
MSSSLRLGFVIALISLFQAVFASPAIPKPVGTAFSGDERIAGKNKPRSSSRHDVDLLPGYRACNRRGAMSHARNVARDIDNGVKRVKDAGVSLRDAWQPSWMECYVEIRKSTVNVTSSLGDNRIRLDGLPPVCMALVATDTHGGNDSVAPVVCGTACIEHENMTGELFEKLRDMLNL